MKKKKSLFPDDIFQKKLITLLKKGRLKPMVRIKTDYFYLISHFLKIFIDGESIKTILKLVGERLLEKKSEINSRKDITIIIFEEIIKACPAYCDAPTLEYIKMEMDALKEIFLQIEKLHEKYRLLIRMRFGRKNLNDIQKELKLPMGTLVMYIEEGSFDILNGLKNEKKDYAANLYEHQVYSLIFLKQ